MRSPAKPIAWLLLVCACAPKVVLGVGTPDVRVVLDVSAAMAQVDSHNMRSSAVAMLLQMLPENANAGVWTFAGRVNVLVEHATTASWDAAIPSDRTRHIVLVARGRVDISDDPALNAAAQDRLLTRLLPQLRDAGFRIHTLAITDDAEVALLKGALDEHRRDSRAR